MNTRLVSKLYEGYLQVRRFDVDGQLADVLSGPGHDVVVVVGVTLDAFDKPTFIVKRGDTRPARTLRNEPYVKDGLVAGRIDYETPVEVLAAQEVEEEVGGRVAGSVQMLGTLPVPTMPSSSTEADLYYLAAFELDPGRRPIGDGWGMEVPELMGWSPWGPEALLDRIRAGKMGETFRSRVAYGRAIEKLGLSGRATTRGLGPVLSALDGVKALPSGPVAEPASDIDGAELEVLRAVDTKYPRGRLLEARATHTCRGSGRGAPYPVQILDLVDDEVEVIPYSVDDEGTQWVGLERTAWPALVAKSALQAEVRSGLVTPFQTWSGAVAVGEDPYAVARGLCAQKGWGAPKHLLSGQASAGQSTLTEHVFLVQVAKNDGGTFLPLDNALARAREEGVSARTEAALLELGGG